jgi:bacterioferritin-associated ferredoxin
MIVCVCRRVSDHQIRQAAAEGARTLECLQFELGVATQCGRCADCATRVLCEAQRSSHAAGAGHVRLHAPVPRPLEAQPA